LLICSFAHWFSHSTAFWPLLIHFDNPWWGQLIHFECIFEKRDCILYQFFIPVPGRRLFVRKFSLGFICFPSNFNLISSPYFLKLIPPRYFSNLLFYVNHIFNVGFCDTSILKDTNSVFRLARLCEWKELLALRTGKKYSNGKWPWKWTFLVNNVNSFIDPRKECKNKYFQQPVAHIFVLRVIGAHNRMDSCYLHWTRFRTVSM
jgi:hypothetical protein